MKTEIFVKNTAALAWVSIVKDALQKAGYAVETRTHFGGYADCPIKVEVEWLKK